MSSTSATMTSDFPSNGVSSTTATNAAGETIIPIVEEVLIVEKRVTDTGRVRVHTLVDEEAVTLHATTVSSVVNVERVPIGRVVDVAPQMREEGNVMIVPVIEEQVFVERRLMLVEEVRITRTNTQVPVDLPATRRIMRAVVERDDATNNPQ